MPNVQMMMIFIYVCIYFNLIDHILYYYIYFYPGLDHALQNCQQVRKNFTQVLMYFIRIIF